MKAYFEILDKMNGFYELNQENIKKAEKICDDYDSVLCMGWNTLYNMPYISIQGEW